MKRQRKAALQVGKKLALYYFLLFLRNFPYRRYQPSEQNVLFGALMRMTCRTSVFVMDAHVFHEEMLVKCNIYLSLWRIMNVKTRNGMAFIKNMVLLPFKILAIHKRGIP